VVTEFIEGLMETYPGLQYLDGFPQVNFESEQAGLLLVRVGERFVTNFFGFFVQIKVVIRADVVRGAYEKVAVISGTFLLCFD
jgi:triose/dihydroxyacetone kinase / FAD-AMP lyase (cyclizing)